MFYILDLARELDIPPRFLGPRLREEIEKRLRQEVEGACNGQHGFVLAVLQVTSLGKGMIREGVGSAVFNVHYKCITFMPHKGEVLDAIVKSVNKVRRRSPRAWSGALGVRKTWHMNARAERLSLPSPADGLLRRGGAAHGVRLQPPHPRGL